MKEISHSGDLICMQINDEESILIASTEEENDLASPHAAHIVKCWNAYPILTAAIEQVISELIDVGMEVPAYLTNALKGEK